MPRGARCHGRPGRNGGGTIDRSPSGCTSSACRFPCRHMATRAADSMTQKFGRKFRAARRNVLPFRYCSEPFRLPKSAKCDADHLRRGVFLICPGSRDASFGEGECYDLEFRPHERSALRNSRYAACDGVDLRPRVRREPRRSGMPAGDNEAGRY